VGAPRFGGPLRVVVHARVGEHDEPGCIDVPEVPAGTGVAGEDVLGDHAEPGSVGVAQAADLAGRADARHAGQPLGQTGGLVPHGVPRAVKQFRGQVDALGGQAVQQPDRRLPPGVIALLDPLDGGVDELAEPPPEPGAPAGLQRCVQLGTDQLSDPLVELTSVACRGQRVCAGKHALDGAVEPLRPLTVAEGAGERGKRRPGRSGGEPHGIGPALARLALAALLGASAARCGGHPRQPSGDAASGDRRVKTAAWRLAAGRAAGSSVYRLLCPELGLLETRC
jgi:hypothetical protein